MDAITTVRVTPAPNWRHTCETVESAGNSRGGL